MKKYLKKEKKLNVKKVFLLLLFIGLIIYLFNKDNNKLSLNSSSFKSYSIVDGYPIIKLDVNNNYSGIGQEKVDNKDGYFTTFTTGERYKKTYIEYKQNGTAPWSNKEYWGGTMAENGCGITSLSIILSGYNKNYTPEDLRQEYFPVINHDKLSTELYSKFGIKNSDFYYDNIHLSKEKLQKHLETNRPILICVWNKPSNNRWTTASHYMVLLAADNEDMVYISNPNGGENDSKSSGWYNFNEVTPYIAKALYIESYN